MLRRTSLILFAALAGIAVGCSKSGSSGAGFAAASAITTAAVTTSASVPVATVPVTTAALPAAGPVYAGATRVDVTPPIGVPLAGYGGGDRRHPFPNLNPFAFDHFLMPSTSVRDPICARVLFLRSGSKKAAIITLDAIATTHEVVEMIVKKAKALGSTVELENLMVCASHSHSGPGCISKLWFWQLTAADLFQDQVAGPFTDKIAQALVDAEKGAREAAIGVGSDALKSFTHNRRSGSSSVFKSDSIDPEMLILRVDDAKTGAPIATLWNFAIHGISLSDSSHAYSADIMGGVNSQLEARANVGIPLFVNSAEGDITPTYHGDQGIKDGGRLMADAIVAIRTGVKTETALDLDCVSEWVDFGQATIDVTSQRLGSQGASILNNAGWGAVFQKLGVGAALGVKVNFPNGWIEHEFRYQAIRLGKWGFASMPGEAIHTIGLDIKARGKALGFDRVFTCGLANGHMAYITTESEYWDGGYEALATFFGPKTGEKLVDSAERQLSKVKP